MNDEAYTREVDRERLEILIDDYHRKRRRAQDQGLGQSSGHREAVLYDRFVRDLEAIVYDTKADQYE